MWFDYDLFYSVFTTEKAASSKRKTLEKYTIFYILDATFDGQEKYSGKC